METSKIGIFENISLQSKLMPYYGSSPEGFLLLSLISKSVRNYQLEHYPQYRRFMFKYAKMIDFLGNKHLEMKLPLDLFKFRALNVCSEKDAELCVAFIHKLTNKEGLYFGEHYMSDQICIGKINVEPERIPTLHPHIESLNSIKVFPFGGQDLGIQHSFLDLIVLCDIFENRDNKLKLKTCFFKDSELNEINPIYESFKKFEGADCYNGEIAFEILNMLKQASIQEIEDIRFRKMKEDDFEQITNLLLNYKIHTLNCFTLGRCESISGLALENISKINPQKLHLSTLSSISSLFRIFLNLQKDVNVSFGDHDKSTSLNFEKTVVLFKTKVDMIKAYCDEIGFSFGENSSQENILFLENYICISNFKEMYVRNLKKENLTTKIALEGLSLDDLNNENCILIPKINLSGIQLDLRDTSSIFANEISVKNFKSLSSKTKIIIELSCMDDLAKLNKIKEYFPEHSELKIGFPDRDTDNTNFDETLLLGILPKFKLTSLEDHDGIIGADILIELLQMPSIQETLEHFDIERLDISKCTSVVGLFLEFKRIKSIEIRLYSDDNNDEVEEFKLKIEQFEGEIKKKHPGIYIYIY